MKSAIYRHLFASIVVLRGLTLAGPACCDEPIDLRLPLPWEEAGIPTPAPEAGLEFRGWFRDLSREAPPVLEAESSLTPDLPPSRHRRVVTPDELRWAALGTAVLIATDERTIHFFDPDLHLRPPGDGEGKRVSRLGTGLPLAVAILAPSVLDGKYGRKTTGLTGMAVLNATLLTEGIKRLVGKERPDDSGGRVRFHGLGSGHTSFPSGHAAASFAAATVLGHRYPKYRLVFYLLAAGVGVARINAARHFPSDVFVGAAIGIYSGRLTIRRGGKLQLWR